MVGGGLRDPVEQGGFIFGNRNHDGVREAEPFDEFTLEAEATRAGMDDLDPHDALLARLGQQSPDLPSRDVQEGTDLVLRLGLVVVQLGDSHREQIFVHGILPSAHQPTREHAGAHVRAQMST